MGWETINYLNTSNITKDKIENIAVYNVSEDKVPSRARRIAKNGDIVYSTVRPNQCHYGVLKEIPENLLVSTAFSVLRSKFPDTLNTTYIYYLLTQENITQYLHGIAENNTSAYPSLKPHDILNLEFEFPHLLEQTKVVEFISSIDRKIELNQRMNETLEEIAKAIFKSWFIDFDPVRAKMEGRPTGLADDIGALFPDEWVDSEIGEIPKGWEVKNFADVFDFLEGPGIRHWQYTNDDTGIKFINIRCIQNGDLKLDTANRITEEEAFGKYAHFALEENDIVVSTSGTLGRYAIVRKAHLPLSLNTSVIRFRPISDISTLPFLIGFVQTQLQYELETRASGSVQRNFGPTHLRQIELLLPPIDLLKKHLSLADPIFQKKQLNLQEIETLSDIRDTLLPKLISGELSIPNAENFLKEADI